MAAAGSTTSAYSTACAGSKEAASMFGMAAAPAAGSRKVALKVAVKVNGVPALKVLASFFMSSRT